MSEDKTMQNKKNIIVSGSIVYDRIMNFPGFFKEHILPEKIHILNVSFVTNELKESFGGTAGNIAYNLSLLKKSPVVLGIVGDDFVKYEKRFKKLRINTSQIKKVKGRLTASAHIVTDQDDNQITSFCPGPADKKYCQIIKKNKNIELAIVAPDAKELMIEYIRIYKQLKISYIFDPGQQITTLTARDLKKAITGSKVLISNDYENQVILNKLKLKRKDLEKMTEILIITKGALGSEIYYRNKKIFIPSAKPKAVLDPTGAGDAYRAGLIKGLTENWSLEKTGRLAGLVAVHAVEKYGTQEHKFSWRSLQTRYKQNFGETL